MLDFYDIMMASALVLIAVAIAYQLKLGIGKTLLIASARTIIQLSFIGLILAWVFARDNVWQVLSILSIMTIIASIAAKNNIKKPYRGLLQDTFFALSIATSLVTLIAIILILKISPWYRPQFIIPILGLILGNSLTAVSLTTNNFINALYDKKPLIQNQLSLGATPFESAHPLIRTAIVSGMTPTINSMAVVGLVSLPGMMTGQILAGADPTQAVRYQIITMFLICAGSSLSCTLCTLFILKRFFNERNQFTPPK